MPLNPNQQVPAYRGKEIEVWVCIDPNADPTANNNEQSFMQVRGAQSFNTTEEKPAPDIIEEMGYEATKAIYGPASYSVSIELLIRDLVHIARLSGQKPESIKRINVIDFRKTNAICYFRDPDTGDINLTKVVSGFKARTASTPMSVGANTTVTLEGACDMAASFDGKAGIVQYVQNSSPTAETNEQDNTFYVPVSTEDEIFQVEAGEGNIIEPYELGKGGWNFKTTEDATPKHYIEILDADGNPLEDNTVVRIVYKKS